MCTENLENYSSKVKRVNIELPNYEFFHSPSQKGKIDSRFIGREKQINKFKNTLTNSNVASGAYLVTGYRGMGKSSFVSKVIEEISEKKGIKKNEKIIPLRLNLGHEVLNERDILSLLVKNIYKEFKKFTYSWKVQLFKITTNIVFLALTCFIFYKPVMQFYKLITKEINIDSFFNENYAVIILISLAFLLVKRIVGLLLFQYININIRTRKQVARKLKELNDRIESSVLVEESFSGSVGRKNIESSFSRKKAKDYPIADARQIEKELIDIIDETQELFFPIRRIKFIIVFDELDKIDPALSVYRENKEEEVPEFEKSVSGLIGGTATRLRKQNVLRLLGNMKYFINTAKAKFIFVAGRELYDAFLADVSDREFAISSIFHEVFYIDSFLSDLSDGNIRDITTMTEHYICKFILPKYHIKKLEKDKRKRSKRIKEKIGEDNKLNYYTIKEYNKYLQKENYSESEINKVIMLLYQFTHYLTHVSNGAPKKTTMFFEQYVYSRQEIDRHNEQEKALTIKISNSYFKKLRNRKNKMFLSFGFNDQSKIGFIHYLSNPIMLAIINNVSEYSDKLLISASFLIDHIYKFHSNGFSWRNLEHTPEILDINRPPELRNFISSILDFLKQTHINPVVSGLYTFKFTQKISEEISFISKMSEEVSAIFNFTLDESLSVKRHYQKLLQHYIKRHNDVYNDKNDEEFIHSIAGIHHILGDLKLFDKEYTEAIFEYQESLKYIQFNLKEGYLSHQLSHLLFTIRTMLKLGLAYEKRKTCNSAYLTYNELISNIIDFRYFDEKELGLKYKIEKELGWMQKETILFKEKYSNITYDDIFTVETMPLKLNPNEKANIIYAIKGKDLIPSLAKVITPFKNKIISRLSLFEDVRLMYLALLAKLFVLEKNQIGGISKSNLDVIEGEFRYLHLATNIKDKFLISSDFFRKLGNIMFYKNGLIDIKSSTLFNGLDFWGYNIDNDIDDYSKNLEQKEKLTLIKNIKFGEVGNKAEFRGTSLKAIMKTFIINAKSPVYTTEIRDFFTSNSFSPPEEITSEVINKVKACNNRRDAFIENRTLIPCMACKYYNRSLKILAENLLNIPEKDSPFSKSILFLKALDEPGTLYSFRNSFSQTLASTLNGFGDILVSCANNKDYILTDFLDAFFKYITEVDRKKRFKFFNNEIEWCCKYRGLIKVKLNGCFNNDDKLNRTTVSGLSNLEKAILYYYASAKYYRRSSNLKEASIALRKILQLILEYSRCFDFKEDKKANYLKKIRTGIIKQIFENIYSSYEHIHDPEIQKLKWNNSFELYENLNLTHLSIFPDLEETIYIYYELELIWSKNKVLDKTYSKIYKSEPLNSYRLNTGIYNRLIALRFKALLSRKKFDELLNGNIFENMDYTSDNSIEFYKRINSLKKRIYLSRCKFDRGKYYSNQLKKLNANLELSKLKLITDPEIGNPTCYKIEREWISWLKNLEHYILDSIFCLHKFLEAVTPFNKTTLFTNSYVADIYQQLFEWTQLYEYLIMLYAYCDNIYVNEKGSSKYNNEKKIIIEKLVKNSKQREQPLNKVNVDENEENHKDELVKVLDEISIKLTESGEIEFKGNAKSVLEGKLICMVDKGNMQFINSYYAVKMAIKSYNKALEMNKEGKTYKNMIDDMYFLNDDLDNDLFKFYLALERYKINIGSVSKNIDNLKMIYNNSALYDIKSY